MVFHDRENELSLIAVGRSKSKASEKTHTEWLQWREQPLGRLALAHHHDDHVILAAHLSIRVL
jgi:hypothetical protein